MARRGCTLIAAAQVPSIALSDMLANPTAAGSLTGLPAGARYLRADLQVHTPADPRFDPPLRSSSDASERALVAREYLSAAKGRGIQLLGITEHNDVSWIDELRYAAHQLEIHLLPGFEVESKEGIHVLCLFDPDTKVGHLNDCLARIGLPKELRETSKLQKLRASMHFGELVTFIQDECGGICIAAHVESDKGLLRAIGGGARADCWKTPGLLAAQISKPPDLVSDWLKRVLRNEEPEYRRGRPIATLLTSDARSFDQVGAVATWIKMQNVGVEGLRQAFLDPESRIAFAPPSERRRGARLIGIRWEGGFLDGVAFALNEELNCLIGGRGAGKSTVIESVRFAFDLPARTEEVRAAVSTLQENALRSGTKVSLLVETAPPSPHRFLIERTAPHAPFVRDEYGNPLPEYEPRQLLVPAVYGQKEIYGVAQDARARLELVDGFAGEGLRDVAERERALIRACKQNASQIIDRLRQTEDAEARLAELPALQEWRRRFREAGFEDKLRERRQLDREEQLLDRAAGSVKERAASLRKLREAQSQDPDLSTDEHPNADLIARAAGVLERLAHEWEVEFQQVASALDRASDSMSDIRAEWGRRRAARAAEFDEALRDLQARMPDVDPERYLDVERRIEQLTPLRSALQQLQSDIETARRDRARSLLELEDARGAKHRARLEAANRMTAATDGSVRIQLEFATDRSELLSRLLALKTGARTENLRRMVEDPGFSPREFARHVRERTLSGRYGLPDGQASLLERQLDEETLLDLEMVELNDRVSVALDVGSGGTRDYRSLEQLSPGQKSTAILLLIMQASRDPLLIDQPEDDLDNRFVYDDVVRRLRAAKPERQFVIATHNANIPVLGDAEQMLVLDAREEPGLPMRGYLQASGSLDSRDVREAAELILEGGEDAFTRRREKYGW